MLRAVLFTVEAAKLADRRFLILRRAIGVPALLAEHLPQVIVDTVVSPLARCVVMPASADLARVGVVLRVGPRLRRRISRPIASFTCPSIAMDSTPRTKSPPPATML
jgi:hypothetical protein